MPRPTLLTLGHPIAPVRAPRLEATFEAVIASARPGRPGVRLAVHRGPGLDPRDLCIVTVIESGHARRADGRCDVRARGQAAVFAATQHDGSTLIAGIAPHDIAGVKMIGPGHGARTLTLSRHGAFLARYAPGTHGRVRVVARRRSGATAAQTFVLPLSERANVAAAHPHRRPHAIFNDEVGEHITQRTYDQIVAQFGPPAVTRTRLGERCAYYLDVGRRGRRGWRFCFSAAGDMTSATGSVALPSGR